MFLRLYTHLGPWEAVVKATMPRRYKYELHLLTKPQKQHKLSVL